MKSTYTRNFWETMEDVSQDIVRACRRTAHTVAAMPWPAMLVCCILLAAVISILPLALFLFFVFMAVKVVVGAFVIDRRRAARNE